LILPAGLWLFSLILVSVQSFEKGKSHPSPFSRELTYIIGMPQQTYSYVKDGTINFWNNYVYLHGVREQNLDLQRQSAYLEMENQMLREQARENERLRSLLNFSDAINYKSLAARIIGWDLSVYGQTMIINKGSLDGITSGQAVMCSQGLIGQVTDEPGRAIAPHSAPVLLVTDPMSRVSVVVERTRDRGILQGTGDEDKMLLVYLSPEARLETGDEISTSGLGGIFPTGVRIGKITRMEINPFFGSPQGWVKPSVDFSRLEEVLVLTGEEKNPAPKNIDPKGKPAHVPAKN